ncbi:DUF6069 family protein [Brachybacterium sp. AOP3-A1-3]|uniref:DUF6069 family protein n=1 Tax=Brachybacterium sp. AOP3-A1-3 TaxID=3457699 RepID=UPI004034CEC3
MSNIPVNPQTPPTGGFTAPPPSSPPAPSPSPRATVRRIRPRGAVATLVTAVIGALLIWAVAVPLGGLDLELAATGQSVGPAAIIGAVLVGGAAAWLLLALAIHLPHGRTIWTGGAVAVLVLSLTGPAVSGAVGAVLVVLVLMHLVVGIVLILGLRRSTAPRLMAGSAVAGRTVTGEAS